MLSLKIYSLISMHFTMPMTHAGDTCKVYPRKTTCNMACLKMLSKRVTDSGSNVTEKSPRSFDLLAHIVPVARGKFRHESRMAMEAVYFLKLLKKYLGFGGGFSRRC